MPISRQKTSPTKQQTPTFSCVNSSNTAPQPPVIAREKLAAEHSAPATQEITNESKTSYALHHTIKHHQKHSDIRARHESMTHTPFAPLAMRTFISSTFDVLHAFKNSSCFSRTNVTSLMSSTSPAACTAAAQLFGV
jgi:hypothetical protein